MVPKFGEKFLEDQAYVENVVRKLESHGQLWYLENNDFCNNHSVWSEAFSSRVVYSIVDSEILGNLSTKLEDEGGYAYI